MNLFGIFKRNKKASMDSLIEVARVGDDVKVVYSGIGIRGVIKELYDNKLFLMSADIITLDGPFDSDNDKMFADSYIDELQKSGNHLVLNRCDIKDLPSTAQRVENELSIMDNI